jgi:hypothetical protein
MPALNMSKFTDVASGFLLILHGSRQQILIFTRFASEMPNLNQVSSYVSGEALWSKYFGKTGSRGLRMYRKMLKSIPIVTAIAKSVATVRMEIASHARASACARLSTLGISRQCDMLQTYDRMRAEITGSGTNRTREAEESRNAAKKVACRIPAIGVCAPRCAFSDV